MSQTLLNLLEQSIRQRNPVLADALQPGLPEEQIREVLRRAKVEGEIEPIVCLFSWKNGTQIDFGATLNEMSPFPGTIYTLRDLKTMTEDFIMFHQSIVFHPQFAESDGRYFPIFWDNSTSYLAVDLKSSGGRVVLLEPEGEELARTAYNSFEDFLKDAIRANQEDERLMCFE